MSSRVTEIVEVLSDEEEQGGGMEQGNVENERSPGEGLAQGDSKHEEAESIGVESADKKSVGVEHVEGSEKHEGENASEGEKADDEENAEEWDEERIELALQSARAFKQAGNDLYRAREWHQALEQYSSAVESAPPKHEELAVFLCNRAACNVMLERWDDVVTDCTEVLKINSEYVKALMRRATAYEKLEKPDLALEDLKKLLTIDGDHREAKRSLARVEPLAKEKFERDKEEMMGKLKELGNSVLGMFGMSLDNFEMKQDPSTGSYSIGMKNSGGGGGSGGGSSGGSGSGVGGQKVDSSSCMVCAHPLKPRRATLDAIRQL